MSQPSRRPLGRRLPAALAAAVALSAGLGARAFLSGAPAKYLGVALWASLVYVLIVLARPVIRPRKAALLAAAISVAVELLQLTPLPAWLSSKHILLRLSFGTTFHWPDLPAYLGGVLLALMIHRLILRLADAA